MGVEALEVYRQMPTELQNIVTHVCILNACSHSGFVDEAENIFSTINDRSSYVVTTMVSISLLTTSVKTIVLLIVSG